MNIVNNKDIGQQNINSIVNNNFGVSELKKDLQRQLHEAENYIDNYKYQTAFNELLQIEKVIEDAELDEQHKNELIAKCYYLKALCMPYNNKNEQYEVNTYYFKAHQLCPNEIKYAERVCTTHYRLGNDVESLALANQILEKDNTNIRANIIKKFLDKDFIIPNYITETPEYKERYINLLSIREKLISSQIIFLFEKEFQEMPLPKNNLEGYELYYWLFVATSATQKALQSNVIYTEQLITNYDNRLLEYTNQLQKILIEKVKNTEIIDSSVVNNLFFDYNFSSYVLKRDKEFILKLYFKYADFTLEYANSKQQTLIVLLIQANELEKAIKLGTQNYITNNLIHLLVATAYSKLDDKEQTIKYLLLFLENYNDTIIKDTIPHFLGIIDTFIRFEEPTTVLEKYFERYIYSLLEYKLLLQAYLTSWDKSKYQDTKQNLDSIKANFDLIQSFHSVVIIIYARIGAYDTLKSILEKGFDRNNEFETHFYILTLYKLKENHILLLELLNLQRVRNTSNQFCIDIELELYHYVKDAQNIEQVALYALEYLKHDKYKFFLIQALHIQGNKYLEVITFIQKWQHEFLNFKLSWEKKFILGHICLLHKQYDIALSLLYGALNENYDFYKKRYLDLMLLWDNTEWAKQFRDLEKVEKDTFIQVTIVIDNAESKTDDESKIQLFEINETTLGKNSIVKAIFGKSKNEVIEIPINSSLLNPPKKRITIRNIAHKYVGVIWKILKEFDNPEENGLEGVVFSLPKTDYNFVEEANKFFIKNFGLQGDLQNIKIKESTALYYQRKIGFSEFLRKIGNSQRVLETYDFLTSNSEGFVVLPIPFYKHILIEQNTRFVADFTTILLLKTISETYAILPQQRIVVSQHLVAYLNNQIFEEESNLNIEMSMSITSVGIVPFFHRKEDKIQKITNLKNLLSWLHINCEVKVSTKILDYSRNHDDLNEDEVDLYKDYLLDTLLLANENNAVLLSEDTMFLEFVQKNIICSVSLEYFLQQTQPKIFTEKLLPYLIERNYLGITINAKNIIQEFEKNKSKILLSGQSTSFDNCINMLSFNYNYYVNILEEVIKFLKYLYSDSSLHIIYRQNISYKVLYSFLKNMPEKEAIVNNLRFYAQYHFNLLGEHKKNVNNDIDFAMDIIRRS